MAALRPHVVNRQAQAAQVNATAPAVGVSHDIPLSSDRGEPADSLLARLDWGAVEERVRAQQRNREVHTPPISLFRWWARRPHALIGAILDGAIASGDGVASPTVSDPFSGGGTVAIEAARRGLPTYAQDLHPWAMTGLRSALEQTDPDELLDAADLLLRVLQEARVRLYGTSCPEHGPHSEVIAALWVRRVDCPACKREVFVYPYSYVSRASRKANERWGWWACQACGQVTRSSLNARERRCSSCRRRLGDLRHALLVDRRARCPHRGCGHVFEALRRPHAWYLALVQRACPTARGSVVHFDRPTSSEIAQAHGGPFTVPEPLLECIPEGLETAVLRRAGLRQWAALYAPRQVETLMLASEAIDGLPHSATIKNRLRLAVCCASEMAGRVWSSPVFVDT